MANVYNKMAANLLGDLVGRDIRAILVMTNTTVDTENDAIDFVSQFTTLDECDATGYARQSIANETATEDDPNNQAEFTSDDFVFSGLGGDATRDIQGVLLYEHVTNDADSKVIAYINFTVVAPKEATSITAPAPAEGWIKAVATGAP